ncbi:DUF397 domain-containing protein [Actinophytocola xanthii]|uniref:DUF397 domain-containing protein n=1 Tax=Actinophytocola xanthii TaxID=1912961 RepID=A0A1Q8CWR3_9PSEU|nr:DUF397 domain-containing protein [Actinophytocola xanthii]OLF18807.1 hypothetical protein BU204_04735 [Actinophytocola xanthii]
MWRKSSFSDLNGNCVEVREDLSALRDSKHPDVHLPVTRAALAALLKGVTTTNG